MRCTITFALYPVAAVATSMFVFVVRIYEIMEPGAVQVFLSSLSNNLINIFIIYLSQKWVGKFKIYCEYQANEQKELIEGGVFSA